jgi:acyl-CoA synthetase (NDP forming)
VGARVAASHTGSLAGSGVVWDRLLKQAGAIPVYSLVELIDMLVTFVYLPVLQGRRLGLFGIGGGNSVLATDECTNAGFTFPVLPQEIQDDLERFFGSKVGVMVNNPVDLAAGGTGDIPYRVFHRISSFAGIDLLVTQVPLSPVLYPLLDLEVDAVLRVHEEVSKPMAMILDGFAWNSDKGSEYQQRCYQAGLPVYHSVAGAAKAISRFLDYHQSQSAEDY